MQPNIDLLNWYKFSLPCTKHIWAWASEWLFYVLPALSNLILVLLGVLLSLPTLAEKIEKTPKYRKTLGAICLMAGLVGFWFDVVQRRATDRSTRVLMGNMESALQNTNALVQQTKQLVIGTSEMVSRIGKLEPEVATLTDSVVRIDTKLTAAKSANNQGEVKALSAERTDALLRLLSVAPGVISALTNKWNECDQHDKFLESMSGSLYGSEKQATERLRLDARQRCSDVLRPLLKSANYIREYLLHQLPNYVPTENDKTADSIFIKAVKNEPLPYDIHVAIHQLERLVQLFAPQPPTSINVTVN